MIKVQMLLVLILMFVNFAISYSLNIIGLQFLGKNPSAIATAMGDVGVAYNPDDAFNISLNPAHLGSLRKDNNFLISTNINNTYESNFNDFGIQIGFDLNKQTGLPLYVGIGYLRQGTERESLIFNDINHNIKLVEGRKENSNSIGLGVSLDYWMNISLGFTYKFISSTLYSKNNENTIFNDGSGSALDAGILLSFPILENYNLFGYFKSDIKFNIGYSILNIGSDIKYGNTNVSLPLNDRFGYSFTTDFKLPINKIDFSILRINWTAEARENLTNYGYDLETMSFFYKTEDPFSKINIPENVFLLNGTNYIKVCYGMKLTAFNTFSYMFGTYEFNKIKYLTEGFEISTKGVVNYFVNDPNSKIIKFINNHFELCISGAKISSNDIPKYDIEFNSICLKINDMIF
jgi:hypothetical protein